MYHTKLAANELLTIYSIYFLMANEWLTEPCVIWVRSPQRNLTPELPDSPPDTAEWNDWCVGQGERINSQAETTSVGTAAAINYPTAPLRNRPETSNSMLISPWKNSTWLSRHTPSSILSDIYSLTSVHTSRKSHLSVSNKMRRTCVYLSTPLPVISPKISNGFLLNYALVLTLTFIWHYHGCRYDSVSCDLAPYNLVKKLLTFRLNLYLHLQDANYFFTKFLTIYS
jgi:hypothetical protein